MSTSELGAAAVPVTLFPVWAGPSDRLRYVLRYAVLAPSRHNAQPWLFEIEGDEARLYADHRRALPVADPQGREMFMSCGAALFNLRVAASHFGHATSVEVLASAGRRDGLVARVRLEERCASTPEIEELFRAIPVRRTNRLPLDSRGPPAGLVTALLREARTEGALLRTVEENERRAVAELIAEGSRIQWRSPRFRAELAAWSRANGTRSPDGMPGYAHGMSDAASYLQRLRMRFTNPGPTEADRDRRRALNTRALVVLSSRGDTAADWLAAGEALQRVLLRATVAGLYASYFNQPIELSDLRKRLRQVLGETGHPQLMFRLGYGLDVRATPRRPVGAVLRSVTDAPPPRAAALVLRVPSAAGAVFAAHGRPPRPAPRPAGARSTGAVASQLPGDGGR